MAKRKVKSRFAWLKDKKHRPDLIVLILILLAGGFWTYQSYTKWQEKRSFEQARASIDALYADIVSKVGQPDNSKKSNRCSRPSLKYEKGPLSCGVGIDFVYIVDSPETANIKAIKIDKELRDFWKNIKISFTTIKNDQPFTNLKDLLDYQEGGIDFLDTKTNLNCNLIFKYAISGNVDISLSAGTNQQNIFFDISCGGSARAEYYNTY